MSTTIVVTGRGEFPLDMLRYDEAYPADNTSSALIDMSQGMATSLEELRAKRRISLVVNKRGGPTVKRWESFGWQVVGHSEAVRDNPTNLPTSLGTDVRSALIGALEARGYRTDGDDLALAARVHLMAMEDRDLIAMQRATIDRLKPVSI